MNVIILAPHSRCDNVRVITGLDFSYAQENWSANFDVIYTKTSYNPDVIPPSVGSKDNDVQFWNFGIDGDYKSDVWSAYLTAAFNAGSADNVYVPDNTLPTQTKDSDFKGWMITVGGNYNLTDMIGLGLDFYYATGRKAKANDEGVEQDTKDFQTLGVIGRPSYYMDDIVFPGWFDDETSTVATAAGGVSTALNNVTATGQTASNQGYTLNNIWSIGVHADFKPLEQTLIQPGFAYMQFAEDVVENARTAAELAAGLSPETGKDLGFSAYLRLNQGITDGLALKATFGYLFAGCRIEHGGSALARRGDGRAADTILDTFHFFLP